MFGADEIGNCACNSPNYGLNLTAPFLAVEIEDPFGFDQNDIDVENRIHIIDMETSCMLTSVLSQEGLHPVEEFSKRKSCRKLSIFLTVT